MTALRKAALVLLVLTCCIGCDQTSKQLAREHLASSHAISYWGGVLRFQYTENTGAFLSLGETLSDNGRFWLLQVMVSVVIAGMLVFVIFNNNLGIADVIAFSLVAAGGASNLVDRMIYEGAVVDFLNVGLGSIRTGVFNLADVAIVVGALHLGVAAFRREKTD